MLLLLNCEGLEMTVNLRCFLAASRSKKQSTQQWIKDYGESTVDVQLEFVALSFAFTQYRTQNVFDFNRNANLDSKYFRPY